MGVMEGMAGRVLSKWSDWNVNYGDERGSVWRGGRPRRKMARVDAARDVDGVTG